MAGDVVKVDTICAPNNLAFNVELFLNKRTGKFYADVGGTRVEADTKGKATERIHAMIAKVAVVQWQPVILLRVDSDGDDEDEDDGSDEKHGNENGKPVFGASCTIRMHTLEDGTRVRIVRHYGFRGYWAKWTQSCSGCTIDHSDRGMGCHECGHTGRRRREHFVPFNRKGFEAMLERLHAREATQAA